MALRLSLFYCSIYLIVVRYVLCHFDITAIICTFAALADR